MTTKDVKDYKVGDNPSVLDTVLSDNHPHKSVHNDSEEILLRTHLLD